MQDRTHSFGYWLRRRRKALDLTQEALAQKVFCSVFSIRKIEADERRPSRRLAERLAITLAVPDEERRRFIDASRTVLGMERLALGAWPVAGAERSAARLTEAAQATGSTDGIAPEVTPLVGREHEFELLVQLLARLADGIGHTVLVAGEPGIGKTRLLREMARYAQAMSLPLLSTKCYEIERAMPYQTVIELISRALHRVARDAIGRVSAVSLAELNALVPEIGELFPDLPTLSGDFPEARQARLARAVCQLLEATMGGGAWLLSVDDIQWADEASAQVLHHLARQSGERAMLVVYAYRDEDADSDERLTQLIDSLCREAAARRLPLGRLGAAHTTQFVAAARVGAGDIALAERLYRETEGNPFFLTSMLQALDEGEISAAQPSAATSALLPDALRAAVRSRLAHVPKMVRPILDTAAVLGRRFDFDTLLQVAGEPETQLLDGVETLVKRHMLREHEDGGVYDFSHDKVREVVYADLGSARRGLLHKAVATVLEGRHHAGEAPEDIAQLAEHYERAQVWTKALHYLVLAGERSCSLFAMRDALHWLDRAVALCESQSHLFDASARLALYERRGSARAQAGQTQAAVADIRRVVDAARASGERERTRDALVKLGMAHRRDDAYEQATACLGEALDEARAMGDERHVADTLYHLGTVAWSTGQNEQSIRHHQHAVEICERKGFTDLVAVQAYHGRGEAHFANAEPQAAIDCYLRSLTLARAIGDRSYESENLMMIGYACTGTHGLGDYLRAADNFEAALAIAREADLQWHLGPTELGLDHVRACTGRYGEAWNGMQQMLRQLEELGQVRYQFIAFSFIGQLLLDLGQSEAALETMQRGQALSSKTRIMFWRAAIDANLAVARSRLGERNAATELSDTMTRTRQASERYMTARCLDALAEVALAAGDLARCLNHADELLALAQANGMRELQASAHRWRGEAWLAQQHYPQAEAALLRAMALADDIGRVRLQLDAHIALARCSSLQDQSDAAQSHFDRARVIAAAIEGSVRSTGLQTGMNPLMPAVDESRK